MSQAPTYVRTTSFADDERDNAGGRSTVATADVDAELDRIAESLNPTIANLSRLQRDDGVMRDGVVPVSALGTDTLKLLSASSSTPRGSWLTATAYAAKDLVTQSGNTYIAVVAHASGTFATDLAAGKWILFQIGANPAASSVPFSPTPNIASANLQAAMVEVDTNARAREAAAAAAVTTTLADTTDPAKNAGSIGFNKLLSYAAGTVGKWLVDLTTGTGATLMGYLAPWTSAALRTIHAHLNSGRIHSGTFSLDKTGATDCTTQLLSFITACRVQGGNSKPGILETGTYKVNVGAISCGSNIHVSCEPGVIIDASGLPNELTSVFNISNQDKVTFEGNGAIIKGARATANSLIEGNSAAFFVYGSDNVSITGFVIQDFATDGITLTGDSAASGPCTNVRLTGNVISNCRRNGISVIHAEGVLIDGGECNSSNGAPNGPWAGIDVEPNTSEFCHDISIRGVRTAGNAGPGLLFVPAAQSAAVGTSFSAYVRDWESVNDGLSGAASVGKAALLFASGGAWTYRVMGQIVVENSVIRLPKFCGVAQQNWDADLAPYVSCRNVRVYDPDGTLSNPDNVGRSGFVVYANSAFTVLTVGNMAFDNCHAEDTRGTPRMTSAFYVEASATGTVKKVRFRNPRGVNFTASAKYDVNVAAPLTGAINEVSVSYDLPSLVTALTGSTNITAWVGKRITSNGAGATYTLPALAKSIGAAYEIYFTSAATTNAVSAQAGETIKATGAGAALTHSPAANDCWRYWNPDGTHWVAAALA